MRVACPASTLVEALRAPIQIVADTHLSVRAHRHILYCHVLCGFVAMLVTLGQQHAASQLHYSFHPQCQIYLQIYGLDMLLLTDESACNATKINIHRIT
jgi:hypothetical protein